MTPWEARYRVPLGWKIRDLAAYLWRRGRLGEVRYLGEWDLALVRVVATLDKAANRLDPPW